MVPSFDKEVREKDRERQRDRERERERQTERQRVKEGEREVNKRRKTGMIELAPQKSMLVMQRGVRNPFLENPHAFIRLLGRQPPHWQLS